jgi:hypothetical protein
MELIPGGISVVKVDVDHLKAVTDLSRIISSLAKDIAKELDIKIPETQTTDADTGVTVHPVFIQTGRP